MGQAEKRIPVREETFERVAELTGAGEIRDDVVRELIEARRAQNRRALPERTTTRTRSASGRSRRSTTHTNATGDPW